MQLNSAYSPIQTQRTYASLNQTSTSTTTNSAPIDSFRQSEPDPGIMDPRKLRNAVSGGEAQPPTILGSFMDSVTTVDYWKRVGGVLKGEVMGVGEAVKGTAEAIMNPIDTATGLWNAATNPKQTAQAVADGARQFVKNVEEGNNEAAGRTIGNFLAPMPPLGSAGGKLVRLGRNVSKKVDTPNSTGTTAQVDSPKTGSSAGSDTTVKKKPIWLRRHQETPTEKQSRSVDIDPATLERTETFVNTLEKGKGPLFHGTTSDALQGLSDTGRLMSAQELTKRNVQRSSGEGTNMMAGAQRNFVSVGEGPEGFGSALRYHDNLVEAPYSFGKVDDASLASERARMGKLAQNSDKLDDLPGVGELATSRLRDIDKEVALRQTTGGGPRDVYPMMFGFKRDGLDLRPTSDVPGELRTSGIDMDSLSTVVVPKAKMGSMEQYLKQNLGAEHGVEIIPSEAIHQVKHKNHDVHYNFVRPGEGVAGNTNRLFDEALRDLE